MLLPDKKKSLRLLLHLLSLNATHACRMKNMKTEATHGRNVVCIPDEECEDWSWAGPQCRLYARVSPSQPGLPAIEPAAAAGQTG